MNHTSNSIVAQDVERILRQDLPWSDLNGSTVLISGASGFLPAYLIETLAGLNDRGASIRIVGLVRNLEKAHARLGHLAHSGAEWMLQDIAQTLRADLPQADFIIHAASQASPKYYGIDPVGTLTANTMGTLYLLQHAIKSNAKRFLFFSSGEIYGIPLNPERQITESDYGIIDPTNVRSCYAESKRMGETMCVAWAHQYGLHTGIVRPFHTYGPGVALDDGRVFADFVADIVNHRSIVLKSDGLAKRPFCYIADATIGFLSVLLKGAKAEAYNVGNPHAEISMRDLAATLINLFPERNLKTHFTAPITSNKYLKSPVSRLSPSIAKIEQLGWSPTTSIEDGFRRTVLSYEQLNDKQP